MKLCGVVVNCYIDEPKKRELKATNQGDLFAFLMHLNVFLSQMSIAIRIDQVNVKYESGGV